MEGGSAASLERHSGTNKEGYAFVKWYRLDETKLFLYKFNKLFFLLTGAFRRQHAGRTDGYGSIRFFLTLIITTV